MVCAENNHWFNKKEGVANWLPPLWVYIQPDLDRILVFNQPLIYCFQRRR